MKKSVFSALVAFLLFLICTSAKTPIYQTYQFNYENVLGTSFELKVTSNSEASADLAEQIALNEIDRLTDILSTYKAESEISSWMKTLNTEEKVSPELFYVFKLFDQWSARTDGALNASAAIAANLWEKAALIQELPDQKELDLATMAMRQPQWRLNMERQTAMHLTHQPLFLNSFVKSYIIQKVAGKVHEVPGVSGAVINMGGDVMVAGSFEENIRIVNPLADAENAKPLATLSLRNRTIATSGNYRRGFQIGQQIFSHILDARTAMPTSEVISAAVVGENATDAGALATAFNILSLKESSELAKEIPGIEYQIITRSGVEVVSEGWKEFISENNNQGIEIENSSKSQDQFEVSIELELARFEGRFRRPFVAVWIENKKKESVRTVGLWFNKPRWLPDLNRWYNKNQSLIQDYSAMSSLSSATRIAGKYTLVWNGLDDSGKEMPSGKYTIYIEAAREHGTHQLLAQEIEWKAKPIHYDLEGGIEITAAAVDLHAKTGN